MRNPFEPPKIHDEPSPEEPADETTEPKIRQKHIEAALYDGGTMFISAMAYGICGAITVFAPGIGIPLIIISSVVLIRMVALDAWRRAGREPPDLPTKVLLFLSSLGIVTVMAVSAVVAFVSVCFPVGWIGASALEHVAYGLPGVLIGIVVGLTASGVLLFYAFRNFFWGRW